MNEGKKPACFANQCEIQHIMSASDSRQIQELVNAFIAIESMGEASAFQDIQRRMVNDSGLIDIDAATLLRMKSVFFEYRQSLSNNK